MKAKVLVNGYELQRHPDLSYEVKLLEGKHKHKIEVVAEGYLRINVQSGFAVGRGLRLTIRLEQGNE
ncbi:hypothetical protein [Desulfonatronospira sp.]|uniref:hypothetical protein n=1 Tax=Desulfonatronospira sp. TaxID=1962951 RepID=UPI0025C3A607|nr:hypothetical protein [Desulfonatronospira sp.]